MPDTKTPGQIAFEGYSQKSQGKDFVTSAPLPNWVSPSVNKEAWEAAATAVMTQPSEPPKPKPEPTKPIPPPNFPPQPKPFLSTRPEPAKAPVQPSKPARTDPQALQNTGEGAPSKSIPTPPSPARSRTSS